MGHADSVRFRRMTMSIIIISNITTVAAADFLVAASLTVCHGLPGHCNLQATAPPPTAAATRPSPHSSPAAQKREKGWVGLPP